jgi:hypothetical protein
MDNIFDFIIYLNAHIPADAEFRLEYYDIVKQRNVAIEILRENLAEKFCDSFLYNVNTSQLRTAISQPVNSYCKEILLCDYKVICDETNNPPCDVASGILNCDLYIDYSPQFELNICIHNPITETEELEQAYDRAMGIVGK